MSRNTSGRLAGKNAVITGGTTGLGFATAKAFLQEGARVLITGQNEERLAAAVRELGAGVVGFRADVRKVEDLEALGRKAKEAFDKVDVLFANAGVGSFVPLEALTEAVYDEQFDTNVKGVLFTVQKLLGLLKPGASVILNASAVHGKGVAAASVYFATKAAVRSLARTLAAELAPRGIRVNSLSPGMVPTQFQPKMGFPPEQLEGFYSLVKSAAPLARLGQPEEIAKAAVFLASEDSSYMTASDVVVDGGYAGV
jgi:NAD(P)-dependent dehydrogenase (short-subunit alcohol dehydrogenase family)